MNKNVYSHDLDQRFSFEVAKYGRSTEKRSRILIIDDVPVARMALEALLANEPYDLHFAENGVEELAMATSIQPDVLLLHVMMPNMNGFEVCQVIRSTYMLNDVPILFITTLFDSLELLARLRGMTRLNRCRLIAKQRRALETLNTELINIGLSVNARSLQTEMIVFALVITLVAIVGKWLGAGIGARLGGLSLRESVQLGAGMVSRGEVGLIVAGVGINQGLVSSGEFSAVVAMVLVTTLVTPPILRSLFSQGKQAAQYTITPVDPNNEETN